MYTFKDIIDPVRTYCQKQQSYCGVLFDMYIYSWYWPLSITKNGNIEFELFSIAWSTGQYFPVVDQLSWVSTGVFSIRPDDLGEY